MTSPARADRILDEFTEGAYRGERHTSIRHGLAAVLRHLSDTIRRALESVPDTDS